MSVYYIFVFWEKSDLQDIYVLHFSVPLPFTEMCAHFLNCCLGNLFFLFMPLLYHLLRTVSINHPRICAICVSAVGCTKPG